MPNDIRDVLSSAIDAALVEELVGDYTDLHRRHLLGDLEPAIAAAGRLCEDIMKCLVFLQEKAMPPGKGIIFEDEYKRIEKYSIGTVDEELLFLLIPRTARGIYAIRSKKRGQHSRGKDLLAIDLGHVVAACDWIVASLLFAVHGVSEDEAIDMMVRAVRYTPPMLIEFDGYFAITKKEVLTLDALLVMLAGLGGEAPFSELTKRLGVYYDNTRIYSSLRRARADKLVFRHPVTHMVKMLPLGQERAEKIVKESLLEQKKAGNSS